MTSEMGDQLQRGEKWSGETGRRDSFKSHKYLNLKNMP